MCDRCKSEANTVEVATNILTGYEITSVKNPLDGVEPFTWFWIFPSSRYDLCSKCHKRVITFKALCDKAERIKGTVKSYSKNYKGNTHAGEFLSKVNSKQFRDRDDALDNLKMNSAILGASVILNARFEKIKCRSGNYIYSQWVYTGDAHKRKK